MPARSGIARTHPSMVLSMKAALILIALAVSVTSLTGCAASGSSAEAGIPGVWGASSESASSDSEDAYLELAETGELSGSDGCNRLIGGWSADDDTTVTFTEIGSTRMACDGVDTWLSGAASATLDGTVMTVLDASGSDIGTLVKRGD